ncbi:MAG: hypothetical protein OEY52_10490 [Gammaproteobacteria bacterium]|nr:hypothetical protein [Gammaproteobacteria bacterium]
MTQAAVIRPHNIDQLISQIRQEFPLSGIRITGRGRTFQRQAELMVQRIRANRQEFLSTYVRRPHIQEMDRWFLANRTATSAQMVEEFEQIIRRAVSGGAAVSNHLSNTARDISWPVGAPDVLNNIENRISELGASVIREPNAAGGRHWHIDW